MGNSVTYWFGFLIAAVVGAVVVADAHALRDQEISFVGKSTIRPVLWGFGVWTLMIVFLPAYLFARASHKRRLPRPPMAPAVHPYSSAPTGTGVTVGPGWFADPTGEHELRYWDGSVWTLHTHDRELNVASRQPHE